MYSFNNYEECIEEIFEEILEYNVEEAIKYCKVEFEDSNNPEYLIYLANAYLVLGMYIESIENVDLAIKKGCNYLVRGFNIKGEAQLELGLFLDSRKSFEKALEISEYDFSATSFLIELDIREGYYDEAINRAIDFIEKNGEKLFEISELMTAIGWIYLINIKNHNIALEAFEESIKNNIECSRAYTGIGYYYIEKKEYISALDNFNKSLEINNDDSENYFGIALCNKEIGNFEEIEENLINANLLDPMDSRVIMEYGFELLRQKRNDEAIEVFQKLIEINPDDYDIDELIKELIKEN